MRRLSNQQGFTIVEVLSATAILMISGLVVGSVFLQMSKSRSKAEIAEKAIEIESGLITAFTDESQYTAAIKSQLAAGTLPTSMTLKVPTDPIIEMKVGSEVCVQSDLSSSLGTCDFTNKKNILQAQVDLLKDPSGSFRYGYRIIANPNLVTMATTGAEGAGAIAPEDHNFILPSRVYKSENTMDCDDATTIGMHGFNKDTGIMSCIKKPTNKCPDGTFARSIAYNEVTNSVEFGCVGGTKKVDCPADYTISKVAPSSLMPTAPASEYAVKNRCIYITKKQWMTNDLPSDPGKGAVFGTVCPPHYKVDLATSSCAIKPGSIVKADGNTCTKNIWTAVGDPSTDTVNPVTGEVTRLFKYISTGTTAYGPVAPNPGVAKWDVSFTAADPRKAKCYIDVPGQQCGATWDAQVTMKVNCVLTETESLPPI